MGFNKKFLSKSPINKIGVPIVAEELKDLEVNLSPGAKALSWALGYDTKISKLQNDYNKLVGYYNARNEDGSMTDDEKQYRTSLYKTISSGKMKKKLRGNIKSVDDIKNFASTVTDFNAALEKNVKGRVIPGTGEVIKPSLPRAVGGSKIAELQLRTLGLYDEIENKDNSYYIQSDFGENFIKPRKAQLSLTKKYLDAIKQKIKDSSSGQIEGSKITGTGYNLKGGVATLDESGNIVFSRENAPSKILKASKSVISKAMGTGDELKQIESQYSKLFNPIQEKFYIK